MSTGITGSSSKDGKNMFTDLPKTTQTTLRRLVDAVADVIPVSTSSWSISTAALDPAAKTHAVVDEVAKWEGNNRAFLYHFRVTNENEIDLPEVERVYAAEKAVSERAFARFIRQSPCLYVGGSQNISQRLKEHLGFGAKGTYAMQLAHWARDLRLELEFTCAKYSDELEVEILQALEDTLWDKLQPMLGRRGKR
jgi:hypothetical protein